jgi:hypothetical protein
VGSTAERLRTARLMAAVSPSLLARDVDLEALILGCVVALGPSERNRRFTLYGGDAVHGCPSGIAASAFGKGSPVSRVVVVWAAPMEDPPDAFRSAPLGGADLDDPLGLDAYP